MNRTRYSLICSAYILGLFSGCLWGISPQSLSGEQWFVLIAGWIVFSLVMAIASPRFWFRGPRWQFWLIIALVGILAASYLQFRLPRAGKDDVSQLLSGSRSQSAIVIGKVVTEPKLTQNNRRRFWLQAEALTFTQKTAQSDEKKVKGKLYVTVPATVGNDLFPGQKLAVRGSLYVPRPPSNPGAFDFKAYLAINGAFAGLKGVEVEALSTPTWGFWQVRKRIVEAQLYRFGDTDTTAELSQAERIIISSMVMGRQAIDLPSLLRTEFTQAGLAHILTASGFHVALVLGFCLSITRALSGKVTFIVCLSGLIFYVGLTGCQPSVLRAGLMGAGMLVGLVTERKVRPLGSLLLTGTLLLLWNPLWVVNLGFQLSFLATFGLIISLPALQRRLDWLPPAIATTIALPIAASLWTLPLLMHQFSTVASYSILANSVAAPLLTVLGLGGILSAAFALIVPQAGTAIATLLDLPAWGLIQWVRFIVHLPGSFYAVGKLSLGIMLLVYALMLLVWCSRWWRQRWHLVALAALMLVILPILYNRLTLVQITVFATRTAPVIMIQDRGTVVLINGTEEAVAKYSLSPFLAQQGINQINTAIDWANSRPDEENWSGLEQNLTIQHKYSTFPGKDSSMRQLSLNHILRLNRISLEVLNTKPSILRLQLNHQNWILLASGKKPPKVASSIPDASTSVLLWRGSRLDRTWLTTMSPKSAIAVSGYLDPNTQNMLITEGIEYYWTGRDGAIQWTPQRQFQTVIKANHR